MASASRILCLSIYGMALIAAETASAETESITVTMVGKLRTGILAIGGETTGTTITANGITWELDFGPDGLMRKATEEFDGRTVLVQGNLRKRSGVETKDRWIVTVQGVQAADEAEAAFGNGAGLSITTRRADSRFWLVRNRGRTTLDITSQSGIGEATLQRRTNHWHTSLRVRLHLRGLESFTVSSANVTVEAAVSSTGEHLKRVSVRRDGQESPVDQDSPFWADIQIVGSRTTIPLEGGYFEIELPAKLLEDNPREITLNWVDFYRG